MPQAVGGLRVPREMTVILNIQGDVRDLTLHPDDPRAPLPERVVVAIREGKVTPDVVRRAAEIARDAILEAGGYWEYLAYALEEAIQEQESGYWSKKIYL